MNLILIMSQQLNCKYINIIYKKIMVMWIIRIEKNKKSIVFMLKINFIFNKHILKYE